jgi:phage replication O-like protein O
MQIVWCVVRKTYGFHKKEDHIALTQIVEMTGLKKPNAQRAITKLKDKNLLVIKKDNHIGNVYQLNKNIDNWVRLAKKITDKVVIKKDKLRASKKITKQTSILRHTKELIYKDNTKDIESEAVASPTPKEKSKLFFKGITDFLEKSRTTPEAIAMGELLKRLSLEYGVEDLKRKQYFWDEIVKFGDHWQEMDHLGKKERWELQKTFEVERRLRTWLANSRKWAIKDNKPKGRQIS